MINLNNSESRDVKVPNLNCVMFVQRKNRLQGFTMYQRFHCKAQVGWMTHQPFSTKILEFLLPFQRWWVIPSLVVRVKYIFFSGKKWTNHTNSKVSIIMSKQNPWAICSINNSEQNHCFQLNKNALRHENPWAIHVTCSGQIYGTCTTERGSRSSTVGTGHGSRPDRSCGTAEP